MDIVKGGQSLMFDNTNSYCLWVQTFQTLVPTKNSHLKVASNLCDCKIVNNTIWAHIKRFGPVGSAVQHTNITTQNK